MNPGAADDNPFHFILSLKELTENPIGVNPVRNSSPLALPSPRRGEGKGEGDVIGSYIYWN
jgi:hypothetical protein